MENHQKLKFVASRSIADKSISELKGILSGIVIDEKINQKEINELQYWVKDHESLIHKNPFREFMIIIQNEISETPEIETIKDLYWLCQKYENDNIFYDALTSDLQVLQGVCHGIMADGVISVEEIRNLDKWLDDHSHLINLYPYDELRSLLLSILKDNIVTDEEILTLKAFFNEFVSIKNNDLKQELENEIKDLKISGICTSDPDINFAEHKFCLTGVFKRAKRQDVLDKIEGLGGSVQKSINLETDYLIVGDSGNPAWAFSCYGRKVERALKLRKKGELISIINEFDFWDIIDDLEN